MIDEKDAALIKEFGDDVFTTGQHLIDNPKQIVHWSPAIDIILGGGVPFGGVVILTGAEKVGKTVVSLHLAGKAQQLGAKIFYLNIEGRLKRRDLVGIKCLNPEDMIVVGSTKKRILAAHQYLKIARELINTNNKAVIILDSISQLCSMERFGSELDEQKRAPEARVIANFLRETSNIIPINDIIVVAITHRVANLGNTAAYAGLYETGGKKIAYALDIRMQAIGREFFPKQSSEPLGQVVTWVTSSTAIAPPGRRCDSYIRYGVGIDEVLELIDLGLNLSIIKQAGSWLSFNIEDERSALNGMKAQGQERLRNILVENKDAFDELKLLVNKTMGMDENEGL